MRVKSFWFWDGFSWFISDNYFFFCILLRGKERKIFFDFIRLIWSFLGYKLLVIGLSLFFFWDFEKYFEKFYKIYLYLSLRIIFLSCRV